MYVLLCLLYHIYVRNIILASNILRLHKRNNSISFTKIAKIWFSKITLIFSGLKTWGLKGIFSVVKMLKFKRYLWIITYFLNKGISKFWIFCWKLSFNLDAAFIIDFWNSQNYKKYRHSHKITKTTIFWLYKKNNDPNDSNRNLVE